MGVFEENGISDVYKNLTKKENANLNQRWTLYLVFCCIIVCFSSFQFGYNLSAMNLIEPIIRNHYDQVYFKDLYYANLAKFDNFTLFVNGSKEFKEKEAQYLEADKRRNNYLDILMSMDEEKIREAQEYKKRREEEIRKKYKMSLEDFMDFAEKTINDARDRLEEGEKKLNASGININDIEGEYKRISEKLKEGRKNLDKLLTILWAITNSLFVFGGIVGAISSKYFLDYYGRKKSILFHYLFTVLGSIVVLITPYISFLTFSPVLIKFGRFLHGIQGGLCCSIIPTYLNEISPSHLRGQIGVFHNLFLTVGIFIGQVFSYEQILGSENSWNFLLSFPILPSIFGFFLFLIFFDETPKYLLFEKNDEEATLKTLKKLRASENVSNELSKMYAEAAEINSHKTLGIWQLFRSREYRLPLICGIILQFTQQFCGINTIFFYSRSILEKAQVPNDFVQHSVLTIGLINFICTLLCGKLCDKFGRKPLLISSIIFMIIDLIFLVVFIQIKGNKIYGILALVCVILFVISYAIALGPIPFIFVAETSSQSTRSSAMSISSFFNWFSSLFLILLFPILIELINGYVFLICITVLVISVCFIAKFVPETKGKSIEEIVKSFGYYKDTTYELNNQIKA